MVRARDGLRRGHAAACEWQMAREALHRGRRSYRRRRAPWPAELRGPPTPRFCVTRGLAAVPPLLGRHARRRWREAPSDRRVSRDLSEDDVETAEDDGNQADGSTGGGGSVALMSAVGRALAHFLPIYERPGGPRSGRRGVPDVGVFIDIASLPSGIDATAGATGAAITTLFAHKLVTVYFHADEALEYHGRSALYRHLARLCKGEGASPEDPWPAIVDLSQPERWPSAAELDSDNCTAIAPAYRIPLPPDAFEAGGDMEGEVMCSDGDEQIAIGRAYRRACEDAVDAHASLTSRCRPMQAALPANHRCRCTPWLRTTLL